VEDQFRRTTGLGEDGELRSGSKFRGMDVFSLHFHLVGNYSQRLIFLHGGSSLQYLLSF
jgi:hypothetical protein